MLPCPKHATHSNLNVFKYQLFPYSGNLCWWWRGHFWKVYDDADTEWGMNDICIPTSSYYISKGGIRFKWGPRNPTNVDKEEDTWMKRNIFYSLLLWILLWSTSYADKIQVCVGAGWWPPYHAGPWRWQQWHSNQWTKALSPPRHWYMPYR